jgi:demethylmenaquinone methyltransferase/2-methoxy-6-polyprenyl-1,4-benzoquinol methylase
MFSAIAPRYDLLNRLLSFNLDRGWRRRAVELLDWERCPDGAYLDACAGTLDLALALARCRGFTGRVIAVDFAMPMLRRGRRKARHGCIRPAAADTLQLPFPDRSFDGATIGWGLRNLADLDQGLAELARVLRPGSRLVILDSTAAPRHPVGPLYRFYFQRVVPLAGRWLSGHATAYSYLPASVEQFPSPESLEGRLAQAGFTDTAFRLLTAGAVAVHWGRR